MKKLFAASSILLAVAMPVAFAQTSVPAPVAIAAPDAVALAAANDMLESMNYRGVLQGMFAQMRQSLPTMITQSATKAINSSSKLDESQKKHALEQAGEEQSLAVSFVDGVFNDPAVTAELLRETAALYARLFSVSELHQMTLFYKTPVGAKILATMPQITGESMQISQRVLLPRVAAFIEKMEAQQLAQ